jgi:hypothetical protein
MTYTMLLRRKTQPKILGGREIFLLLLLKVLLYSGKIYCELLTWDENIHYIQK